MELLTLLHIAGLINLGRLLPYNFERGFSLQQIGV